MRDDARKRLAEVGVGAALKVTATVVRRGLARFAEVHPVGARFARRVRAGEDPLEAMVNAVCDAAESGGED